MKVQFNNFQNSVRSNTAHKNMLGFKAGSMKHKLVIQNKNPLISDETRKLAAWFNDFYLGIENQINSHGYHSFRDALIIDGQEIELCIEKNPYPTIQIGKIIFNKRPPEKFNTIENITYYPQQQSGGKWWDHIYDNRILYGNEERGIIKEEGHPESDERTPKLCEIFVKYARAFKGKLEPLKESYQFVEYPIPLWKR